MVFVRSERTVRSRARPLSEPCSGQPLSRHDRLGHVARCGCAFAGPCLFRDCLWTVLARVARFLTPRPVLVPPWTVTPPRSRAFAVTSTPCQYQVRAGPKLVSNVWKFWAPRANAAGVGLYDVTG